MSPKKTIRFFPDSILSERRSGNIHRIFRESRDVLETSLECSENIVEMFLE